MFEHENKLLEVAVRPLADNAEMQLTAVGLLETMADKSQAGADRAISRWESVDAARQRPVWKWSFVAVLIGLSAWAWTVAGKEALAYWRLQEVSTMHRFHNDPDYPAAVKMLDQCLPGNLTQHERWLFLGDPSQSTRVEAIKALWDSAPDDPAFHMEYVFSEYESRHKGAAPVDFLETAGRLDPGNSWPYYAAGAFNMGNSIKEIQRSPAERAAKVLPSWQILDQGKLDEGIALLHDASLQPGFDTYQGRLMKMRQELFPVEDHLGYLAASKVFWLEHWGNQSPCAYLSVLPVAAAAKSQQLAMTGDKEGFVQLISDVERLNRRWVESEIQGAAAEGSFSDSLWRAIPRLRASAVSLGLPNEAARLDDLLEAGQSNGDDDSLPDGFYDWFESHSSTLLFEFRRFYSVWWCPKWNAEDLKPGRMADHELLSRGCVLAVWLIFGLGLLGLALYRFRLPRLIRRLAARIGQLLDARDHAWIIGAGVVLPYGFTMVINQLTPLGGRDWSIIGNHLMLPMAQFFGMAVLMLLVPVMVARWRLGRKTAVLGLTAGRSKLEMPVVVCAAISIPVSGWLAPREWYAASFPLLIFLSAFLLVWLMENPIRAVFGSGELRLLHRAVISRALIPAYATAMLLMVIAAPFHKAAERAWFRRDTTMTSVPGFPAVNPYDYRVAEEIRRDVREILEMK